MLSQQGTSPVALRPHLYVTLYSQSCFLLQPGPLCLGHYWSILKSWTSVPTRSFRTALSHHWSGGSCVVHTPPQGLPHSQPKWTGACFLSWGLDRIYPLSSEFSGPRVLTLGPLRLSLPTWSGTSQTCLSRYFLTLSLHGISKVYAVPELFLTPGRPSSLHQLTPHLLLGAFPERRVLRTLGT